jgi:hypothetical protein
MASSLLRCSSLSLVLTEKAMMISAADMRNASLSRVCNYLFVNREQLKISNFVTAVTSLDYSEETCGMVRCSKASQKPIITEFRTDLLMEDAPILDPCTRKGS